MLQLQNTLVPVGCGQRVKVKTQDRGKHRAWAAWGWRWAVGEFRVAGGISRVGGFQGELPAGSRKRKIGIPDVPQTRLVSVNIGGILSVGSQKCIESEGESRLKREKGKPLLPAESQVSRRV